MFDHVKFGVSDYEKSKTFFLEALRPLGVNIIDEGTPDYGVEMSSGDVSLCLYQTHDKPAPLHIAFVATTRQQVDDFYNAALRTGAQDNGAPGLRSYGKNYYAAFVIAPDGHNIEAVCHAPESGLSD
ncbi:TPA: VOC family protein [Enterobacter mori]|uniref:VOC family protein n=1 Tax=Enterobacter quasimori TaxID=2838947 RepID=A0ABY0AUV9_9ENTR|nr:VOC family protein [Enterobacter quasimori]RTN25049.1 VOC family protein [Enterobacter quasimori]